MAARRCLVHGNFPADYDFQKCPVCGESTSYMGNAEAPDDWADQVAIAQELEATEHEAPLIPHASSDVRVKEEAGAYWIHIWDLYAHGIRDRLDDQQLIQVGKQTFEILDYVPARREYLVRPFSLELSDEDLYRLVHG